MLSLSCSKKLLRISILAVGTISFSVFAQESARMTSGTAFAITKNGYLATNAHVVQGATKILIASANGMKADAQIVALDPANDLAVIKADVHTTPLFLDGAYQVRKGSEVSTLGFPNPQVQGRESKFTTGVINAETGMQNDVRFFQISAPVQPGNSGGALLDSKGSVVGIVSAKLNAAKTMAQTGDIPQNVNYAVKIKYLLAMIDSIPNVRDELITTHPKSIKTSEDVARLADSATFIVLASSRPENVQTVHAAQNSQSGTQRQAASDILCWVNGKPIPMAQMEMMISGMRDKGQKDTPELRSMVREELINRAVLMDEAERLGFIAKEDIKEPKLVMARQAIGIRALVSDYVRKHPIPESQMEAEYRKFVAQSGHTQYLARHILVKTEDAAYSVIARLNNGERFESLAAESLDPKSAQKGGVLDWAFPTGFVKPFSDAMMSLSPGAYTNVPVKTQFGYHVILLEETRPGVAPPFEKVRNQIAEAMQQVALKRYAEELRKAATVQ